MIFTRLKAPALFTIAALAFAVALPSVPSYAQISGQAFTGFRGNNKDPIQIEADELEVIDAEAKAIFRGNVKVRQGESLITTSNLVVHYKKNSDGGQGDIDRLVMTGGLIVTSKDNEVTSDNGTYSVTTEDIVLTGNVIVSQGKNVASGCTLLANLKTNVATIKPCKTGPNNRVKLVLTPGSAPKN